MLNNLVTGNKPPKSRNENQGKLRVRFKFQVGNPRTNLAEIWPTYCQIVFLKKLYERILISFFVFELEYFFKGSANELLSLTSTAYNKRTNALDKI